MTDEIAQLLKSLHLRAIAECLDDEVAAAEKAQLSYQEWLARERGLDSLGLQGFELEQDASEVELDRVLAATEFLGRLRDVVRASARRGRRRWRRGAA